MRKLNRNPNKWNAKDRPGVIQSHAKNYAERKISHPRAKDFTELTEENRASFLAIAELIRSIVPDVELFIFGSRVNGNFEKTSDFDVVVRLDHTDKNVEKIRALEFPVKVDLKFDPIFKYHVQIPK